LKALIFALALIAAGPAAALSVEVVCDPAEQTVENSFRQFDGYANPVVMAYGELRAGPVIDEQVYGYAGQLTLRRYQGSFSGKSATASGFTAPFSARVIIQQECRRDACFPQLDGSPWLVFLQKTDEGYFFEANDIGCGPSGFARPSPAELERAIACLKGGCR
jgi:hypothetical protein